MFRFIFIFLMKIIPLNIRDIGCDEKKGRVQDICRLESPCVFALQETKSREIKESWVEDVWGNSNLILCKDVLTEDRVGY